MVFLQFYEISKKIVFAVLKKLISMFIVRQKKKLNCLALLQSDSFVAWSYS